MGSIYAVYKLERHCRFRRRLLAVDVCRHYCRAERCPLKRRPTALAKNLVCRHRVHSVHVNHRKVCIIPGANKPSAVYRKQSGRVVAHNLNYTLKREIAPYRQVNHSLQRELYHGHARGRVHAALFFLARVRSMVGADHVNVAVSNCLAQRPAVMRSFDSRVALDM